jgi:hypothetical protein
MAGGGGERPLLCLSHLLVVTAPLLAHWLKLDPFVQTAAETCLRAAVSLTGGWRERGSRDDASNEGRESVSVQ